MMYWAAQPRVRGALTVIALVVGSVLGAGVLIAGRDPGPRGAVYDAADGVELVAYPVQRGIPIRPRWPSRRTAR